MTFNKLGNIDRFRDILIDIIVYHAFDLYNIGFLRVISMKVMEQIFVYRSALTFECIFEYSFK